MTDPIAEGCESPPPAGNNTTPRITSLFDIPTVASYLLRIGAVERSMCAAVVKVQQGGYSRDLATIKLNKATGAIEVSCNDGGDTSSFEPKETEAVAIKAVCAGLKWIEPKLLQSITKAPPMMKNASAEDRFEFRNTQDKIVMVQIRTDDGKGGKNYIPFTFFDDNQWRPCETDGPLPLYGAEDLADNSVVFIHEGAKAAAHIRRLVAGRTPADKKALADHPWGQDFLHAAHLGWIGGALSPHRTDWSVLAKAGIKTVYIVADNDEPGHAAIPKIAKLLRGSDMSVFAIRFDDSFPTAFDLADDFPNSMFGESLKNHKVYKGLLFNDCLHPATWATTIGQVPTPKVQGRPQSPPVYLRDVFTRSWWMVASEGKALFINQQNRSKLYSEEAFNTAVRPFSDTRNTAELFKANAYNSIVEAIAYEPGSEEGTITVEGERCINTWTQPRIKARAGDPSPWLEFVEHLFPQEEDRTAVMKWVATLVARPKIRMRYGLLLSSTMQGVGKTTLCEILRVLVGEKNCSSPSVKDVIESAFNSWIVRKRLCFVNEIYEGGKKTAYEKMKSYLTDQTLEANEKMVKGYSIRNWAHFILCSNAEVPLSVEQDDRRFLVPEVTGFKKGQKYWEDFYGWLEAGGYSIIAHWADEFCCDDKHVKPSDIAPETARKRELIEDSRSEYETLVIRLADHVKSAGTGRQVVVIEAEVVAWIENQTTQKLKPSTIRGYLKKAGLFSSKQRFQIGAVKSRIATVLQLDDAVGWSDISPYRMDKAEFDELGQM